jgi:hypothetical protein
MSYPSLRLPPRDCMELWEFNQKLYLRTSHNELWEWITDVGCGTWCGIYLPAENRIDTTVLEPIFEQGVPESDSEDELIHMYPCKYCPGCGETIDLHECSCQTQSKSCK